MNTKSQAPKENMLANLLVNIVIPSLILMKASDSSWLLERLQSISADAANSYQANGPALALILALSFPLLYGLNDFVRHRRYNFFSILGFISILLTGGISLLQLDPSYIAIKEAAIPALIGLAVLGSLKTRYPLVKTLLYNGQILQVDKVEQALKQQQQQASFERVLQKASLFVASSFGLSSVLNYALAKYLLISLPGTAAFNEELGKMTALSYPIIAIPSMLVLMGALFYLFYQIKQLTGLALEDILNDPSQHNDSPVKQAND